MKSLTTYLRILRYARRYWKHITASVVSTIWYSLFSGVSIYLFIPLLDVLFHPEKVNSGEVSDTLKIPFGLGAVLREAKEAFVHFVFSGNQLDALFRICVILVAVFLLKNVFGYLQAYFMNYAEEGVIKDIRN